LLRNKPYWLVVEKEESLYKDKNLREMVVDTILARIGVKNIERDYNRDFEYLCSIL